MAETNKFAKRKTVEVITRRKFLFDGTQNLVLEICRTYTNVDLSTRDETTILTYPLTEVTVEELIKHRASKKPGFVLKWRNHFYYTPIPRSLKFLCQPHLGIHLCAYPDQECKHFTPLPDCEGGCAKVRDISIDCMTNYDRKFFKSLLISKRIEKYPFIIRGYETFNTSCDTFVVLECSHYEKI